MARSKRTEELLSQDLSHVIHPFTTIGEATGPVFEEGHGITLKDTDGKEYMDFSSGLIVVNVGYSRAEIAEAVYAQMKKLSWASTFYGYSNTATIQCANILAELVPKGLDHFFFCCGGSEAVESAIKIARAYWRTKGTDKHKIISLNGAYHGATFGALAAGGLSMSRLFGPIPPGSISIPGYYCYRCEYGEEYPNCNIECARSLAETIEREGEDSVAAFIAEPVQGVAGMIAPPSEYWPLVRKICTEHNVLLIADEVMTGFGRTGKMFAVEHWDVTPDLMTMAKGITSGHLPFAAVAVSDKIHEGLKGVNFPHGFTYSGHPSCCTAAVKNMEILVKENLAENAAKVGNHILDRLKTEFIDLPYVGDVSGLGLMIGIELVKDKARKTTFPDERHVGEEVIARAQEKGLLIRKWGGRLGIGPPLIVTLQEADRALDILKHILTYQLEGQV